MERKFKMHDLVWAKSPNIPNWPAIILDDPVDSTVEETDENLYCCFLFGHQELVHVKESNIEPYEEFSKTYKKCYKGGIFQRAVKDIEEIIFNLKYVPGYKIDLSPYKSGGKEESKTNGDGPANGFHNGGPEDEVEVERRPSKRSKFTEDNNLNKPSTSTRRNPPRRVSFGLNNSRERRLSSDSVLVKSIKSTSDKTHHVTADSEPSNEVIRIESDKRIGFIGVGVIGEHFAKKIISAGCKLYLWNRTRIKCDNILANEKLNEKPVVVCETPRDVAKNSDIIFSCLNDDNAVKFVLFDEKFGIMQKEDKIFGSIVKNKIYVEMSTITVELSEHIQNTIHDFGGEYVEMQFQGSRKEIEERKLLTYYAGDREATNTCNPYFHLITDRPEARYVGKAGRALQLQAFLQLIRAILLTGVAEGLALAAKCDIPVHDLVNILKETRFTSPYLISNIERMINMNFHENIQQRVELMNKDISLAIDLGNSVKVDLMMACAAKEIYKNVRHMGFDGEDVSCVTLESWGPPNKRNKR